MAINDVIIIKKITNASTYSAYKIARMKTDYESEPISDHN